MSSHVAEEKTIESVFPNLELRDEMEEYLSLARVGKVGFHRQTDTLHVLLVSRQWIAKKYILQLEKEIKRQLFSDAHLQVKVTERFSLSSQYTPKLLMEVYRPSLQLETRERDILLLHVFNTARFSYPDDSHIVVSLPDTMISRQKEQELIDYLRRVLVKRCGLTVELAAEYRKAEKNQNRDRNDRQMAEAARHIFAQSRHALAGDEEGELSASKEAGPDGGEGAAARTGEGAPASGRGTKKAGPARKKKGDYGDRFHQSDDPNVLYGRDFEDDSLPIAVIDESMTDVVIRGQIISSEIRTLRKSGKALVIFAVTDDTDTIKVKIFIEESQIPDAEKIVSEGSYVKLKGRVAMDPYERELGIGSVLGIRRSGDFRRKRFDDAVTRRVELHCHTKMSDMDGVSDAAGLVKRAHQWGMPAIAITDHGVVQAFPEANHAMEDIDNAYRDRYKKEHPEATREELKKISDPFKVLYGMEAYLVDDLKGIAVNSRGQSLDQPYVVFDIETTGLSNVTCKIIEIGAVRVEKGAIVSRFSTFVNPKIPIPYHIEQLTSITDTMVIGSPEIDVVLPDFMDFCEGAVMVAHNADFDMGFIIKECERQGIERDFTYVDTIAMARILLPTISRFRLDTVAKALGVNLGHHHRAVDDAACTADIFVRFVEMLKDQEVRDLDGLNQLGRISENSIRKMRSNHAIILAKNEIGRVNLYRCVSESHLRYFNREAKLPKSFLEEHREGLIVGSACEAGELYQALIRGAAEAEIARIVSFYDYLEIQPLGNNTFMIADDRNDAVRSQEDLKELNRRICKLGEQFHKPVVATCDVHFMDPEDETYRRIIMAGKGFKDADDQPPLYLRTTEEMLAEFDYLGREKALEVCVTNTRKIADMCDKISPIRSGKFPPIIKDSDQQLRDICHRKAHEIYGPRLPEIVEARLERELNSIISNGYAVMYIIAQKLVWKCNEDGYLVGSRGSVGSSFAATMSGITEVNPLPPHYLCAHDYHVEFDTPDVDKYQKMGMSGCDMPDKPCPVCGRPMQKLGFNIPFETFLGFKGNKEPDIDLNFSGEYQTKAHAYTQVIFGAGQTYKAGTIGTLADKTAFGYVKNYYEEKGIRKRNCEIDRIVKGCTGIRRTTGQHPGGIVVLPVGEDINSFTPVQHPADDPNSDIISTHFDYHSIDSNLLKLDILGHDDPTMIKVLEDLTGEDATKIPFDEPKVMSLFQSTEALGVTPEEIRGVKLGCLGIPEFGTSFAMQMLRDTKPQNFTDLCRISGLSHGTDVYLGNAETLIKSGTCTLSSAICCRDDIMVYLINKGLDSEQSFTIMEMVRKGIVAKGKCKDWAAWSQDMLSHDVPQWYIESCEKIKYMFPKGHAVAYVMMAYRVGWFKVYRPLAYYAAFFSIRAKAFSYEKMCMGKQRLEEWMDDYTQRKDELSNMEQDQLVDMSLVQEMYARGFEFMPIDLYRAQAHRFQIIDGRLMPSLDSIDGLGATAAEGIVLAARDGIFKSKDDFRRRAKVGKTVTDSLTKLGIMGDLPETNQISLFDFSVQEAIS